MKLLLTCEHGGNDIPEPYRKDFIECDALKTHRGYDLGALDLFKQLKPLADASFYSTTSRLLIELNRSLHHKQLFSEFTKNFSQAEKEKIIESHYLPYRTAVGRKVQDYIQKGDFVLHLSIHSFTPELNSVKRNCDIGLLYDSTKKGEKELCKYFKDEILTSNSDLNVRFNYPYLGKADGFTTFLRKQFPERYIGVEIEINQKFTFENRLNEEVKEIMYQVTCRLKSTRQLYESVP